MHCISLCSNILIRSQQRSNLHVLLRIYSSKKIQSPAAAASNPSAIKTKPAESFHIAAEPAVLSIFKKNEPPRLVVLKPEAIAQRKADEWQYVRTDLAQLPQQYLMLSKIRLTSLVVITSMAGYALATAPFDPATFLYCSLGTGLLSSAANSINQFLEVPFDAQMSRTKNRVLVRGNLTPLHAIGFAAASSSLGLLTLYYGTNGLTMALGAANLVLYTMIYTPLKRISILNTWVGSIVGAIPPLMGWSACAGSLGPGAWVMAGLLYAWQFPHFNALSWNLRPDYSRAGYRMMSVTNPGLCRRTALRYTIGITALSTAAPLLDVTNWYFAAISLPLNSYFTYLAYQFYRESDSGSSRRLFRFSLIHLPVLMTLLLVTKKHWYFTDNSETISKTSSDVLLLPNSQILQPFEVQAPSYSNSTSDVKVNTSLSMSLPSTPVNIYTIPINSKVIDKALP